MALLLRKYRKLFGFIALSMVFSFTVSSVSLAYTSMLCKMKMDKVKETKKCCCKMSEEEETLSMSCGESAMDISKEVRYKNPDGCCCVISKPEGRTENFVPVTVTNTYKKISHEGSLISELPTPNNIFISRSNSPWENISLHGRSMLIFNSVLRI